MKALKHWYFLILSFWVLPFFMVQAEPISSDQLITVPTREVEPLQVLISSTQNDDLFAGEVLARRPLQADFLQFTLLNEFDGVVWKERLKLPTQPQRIMPFYFEDIGATGRLFLSVEAYDDFGNTAGSGQKNIEFEEKVASVTINSSEVFLDDQNELSVDLFVLNGPARQSYIPQIKIYQGLEHFGDLVATEQPPLIDLQPRQQQALNFRVPFDYASGVYEIVIQLLDASSRNPLSSAHYRQIYKPGYFFKVVDLQSYYTAEDKSSARLQLDGLSTVVLTEPVQMQVRLEEKQNIYLDQNYSFTLQPGYFTKYVDLNLPSYVEELNGSATFFLNGLKIQTVNFSSAKTDDRSLIPLPETPSNMIDFDSIPPMVEMPSAWHLSDGAILAIVIGCTLALLILVFVIWIKSRWLLWVFIPLIGFSSAIPSLKALTVGRDVFPMVEWSSPALDAAHVYNPSSEDGFQWLAVKGRLFNFLTQTALLKGDAFSEIRLNLLSPGGETYQYFVEPSLLKPEVNPSINTRTGDYFFILDLRAFEDAEPLNQAEPLAWENGRWQLQLVFPYAQREADTIFLSTPLDEFGFFEIDQQPPLWQWQLKTATGEVLGESDFTNQPVTVSITCQDQDSACVTPFQNFSVVGNFCGDALKCNTQAARDFSVCDTAGNCRTEAISVSNYDPIPPQIESLLLNNAEASAATEVPTLNLRYADPNRVDTESLPIEFNAQLCGENNTFFGLDNETWQCNERLKPCVLVSEHSLWRGDSYNGVCEPACPEGFQYQNGTCQVICGTGEFDADRICLPFNLDPDEA